MAINKNVKLPRDADFYVISWYFARCPAVIAIGENDYTFYHYFDYFFITFVITYPLINRRICRLKRSIQIKNPDKENWRLIGAC